MTTAIHPLSISTEAAQIPIVHMISVSVVVGNCEKVFSLEGMKQNLLFTVCSTDLEVKVWTRRAICRVTFLIGEQIWTAEFLALRKSVEVVEWEYWH